MWYIMFLIIFTYRGLGFQEIVSFVLFYGLRAVFMNCFEFDHPDMNFNDNNLRRGEGGFWVGFGWGGDPPTLKKGSGWVGVWGVSFWWVAPPYIVY